MNILSAIVDFFGNLSPDVQGIIVLTCTIVSLAAIFRSGPRV